MPDRPFQRTGSGVVVALPDAEVDVLRRLAGELAEVLQAPPSGDPVVERLFPRAYDDPTEQGAEAEWQALAGSDLARERLERIHTLVAALDAAPAAGGTRSLHLDEEAVQAWLGVLNDTRLALASRIGIGDEGLDVADPGAPSVAVYRWLTYLLGELVDVLLGDS